LLWLAVRGSSIPLYYEWLTQHPKDAEIADRLEKAREEQKRIDADTARIDAFSQLNAGHVDEAEKGFQQALAYNAKDAAALGGVGLVAERQHDWQRAEQNFKLAMEADPATAGQWSAALAGVRQGMAGNSPLPAHRSRGRSPPAGMMTPGATLHVWRRYPVSRQWRCYSAPSLKRSWATGPKRKRRIVVSSHVCPVIPVLSPCW
jgi:tetratricopeptide (TPR) repeat protein